MSAKHTAFVKASLREQVQRAATVARDAVLLGIDTDVDAFDTTNQIIVDRVALLIGHDGPNCDDAELHKIEEVAKGAYALGIAVGLLLRPGAFDDGGVQ